MKRKISLDESYRWILILLGMIMVTPTVYGQEATVRGQVFDQQTGETLPGVNVIIKGTTTGTSTDSEGNYELNVSSMQDTLVFSFVGYKTREVPINGRSSVDVKMQSEAIAGEEVVVVGYGAQRSEDVTGSVGQVEI